MRSFMYFKITWLNKWFSTSRTSERFLSRVHPFVQNEGIGTCVRLPTLRTCIRVHTSMSSFVHVQVTFLLERFPTCTTCEGFHAGVCSFVHFEARSIYKWFPTGVASESFPSSTYFLVHFWCTDTTFWHDLFQYPISTHNPTPYRVTVSAIFTAVWILLFCYDKFFIVASQHCFLVRFVKMQNSVPLIYALFLFFTFHTFQTSDHIIVNNGTVNKVSLSTACIVFLCQFIFTFYVLQDVVVINGICWKVGRNFRKCGYGRRHSVLVCVWVTGLSVFLCCFWDV